MQHLCTTGYQLCKDVVFKSIWENVMVACQAAVIGTSSVHVSRNIVHVHVLFIRELLCEIAFCGENKAGISYYHFKVKRNHPLVILGNWQIDTRPL